MKPNNCHVGPSIWNRCDKRVVISSFHLMFSLSFVYLVFWSLYYKINCFVQNRKPVSAAELPPPPPPAPGSVTSGDLC